MTHNRRDTQTESRRTGSGRRHSAQRLAGLPALLTLLVMIAVIAGLVLLFPMDWVRTPSITLSIEQEAFSPNQDGSQDTAIVLYALSENASVSAVVLDDLRTRVRTLTAQDAQLAGQHSVVWDGRDDHGKVVTDGQYYVRLTAKGSARESNSTAPILVDTRPPIIRLANMPEAMRVKEELVLIEGLTEPDATVWLNNEPQPIPIDSSGGFQIEYRLREGDNTIELSVTDAAGNRASTTRDVALIVRPPDILVDNPPSDLWINQKLLSVLGSVPPDTAVTVNGKKATVDSNGDFTVDVLLQEGENTILVQAVDLVGNTSEMERRVFLKTRPPALSLSSVKEGMHLDEPSLLVVGQTEVGASVRLNGRELAVDSRGGFQGLVSLVQGDNLIKAEAVDRAGNSSTLSRRVAYALPTTAQSLPPGLNVILPALVLAAGSVLAFWLLGGWLSPISISFAADRSALLPDGRGQADPVLLNLELSRSAKVTVDIWDSQDLLIATLLYRRKRGAGEHVLVWDGRDDQGRIVPVGPYEIQASASTLTTSVSSSVPIRVDSATPLLGGRRTHVSTGE